MVTKENVCYYIKKKNFIFQLILSNLQGWGVVKFFISGYFFNKFFAYYYEGNNKISNFNSIVGFYKNYVFFLKIKGMGFKSVIINKNLIFKLGCSHKILYVLKKNFLLIYKQKYLFKINTRCLNLIKNTIYILKKIKVSSFYKLKGIFIKGSLNKLKISSKKTKF